jgi:hypothetical protein
MPDFITNAGNYKKLWAFIVGYGASWLMRRFGLDIAPILSAIIDLSFGILTGFFVWLVPNIRRLFHVETTTTSDADGEVTKIETTVSEMDKSSGKVEAVATAQVAPIASGRPAL